MGSAKSGPGPGRRFERGRPSLGAHRDGLPREPRVGLAVGAGELSAETLRYILPPEGRWTGVRLTITLRWRNQKDCNAPTVHPIMMESLLGLFRRLTVPSGGDATRRREEQQLLGMLTNRAVMWEADVAESMGWSEAETIEILEALEETGFIERYWTPRGNVIAQPHGDTPAQSERPAEE